MIINFDRIGQGGGSGSGYTLPTATETRLGGVKIGSGITVDSAGTISVEGGTGGGVSFNLDAMTQQERADFVAYMTGLTEDERVKTVIYKGNARCVYGSIDSGKVGLRVSKEDGWSVPVMQFQFFFVKPDGDFEYQGDGKFANVLSFYTDIADTDHTLTQPDHLSPLNIVGGLDGGDARMALNVKLITSDNPYLAVLSTTCSAERDDPYGGYLRATFDYSGQTISAEWRIWENSATNTKWEVSQGGGGAGDYQVVSGLPASAEEGQLFYVPEHTQITATLSGWVITDIEENDTAGVVYKNGNELFTLYTGGEDHNFATGPSQWITSTDYITRTIDDTDILCKIDGQGNCWLYFAETGITFVAGTNTTAVDSTYEVSETIPGTTYRYLNGQFNVLLGSGFSVDSAGTISVEGGTKMYILNLMTQAELKDLYDEISPYGLNDGYNGVSSAFPANNYAFYIYFGSGNNWDGIGDTFRGTLQVYLAFIHPTDLGGALFFTGVAGSRQTANTVYRVRFIVGSNGDTVKNVTTIGVPGISPFGFSYPDNGMLSYDLDNQKFIFTNWYDGTYMRDVDTTGSTPSIINRDWVDSFYNNGMFFASDRNAYATPCFGIRLVSGNTMDAYTFPKICVKGLSSPVTIDGRNYDKQYWFTYTKEDGSTFTISMLLNPNSYGAQMTYTAH